MQELTLTSPERRRLTSGLLLSLTFHALLLSLAFGGQASADNALWLAGARAFFKDKS